MESSGDTMKSRTTGLRLSLPLCCICLVACLETSPLESSFKPEPLAVTKSSSKPASSSQTASSFVQSSAVASSIAASSSSDTNSSSQAATSSASSSAQALPLPTALVLSLTYNGPVVSGNFYQGASKPKTDYGFWIETKDSAYVKTLKVNKGLTSTRHPSMELHLPQWFSKSGVIIQALNGQGVKEDSIWIDGISGASVMFSAALAVDVVTARWDFTDSLNLAVHPGEYRFCAEVAAIKKDSVTAPAVTPIAEHSCGSFRYDGTDHSGSASGSTHILALTAVAEQ